MEHPVTEMVTGIDLVGTQLRLAEGQPFKYSQEDIKMRGSAIEARVIAEDPDNGFMPATGEISHLKEAGGPGVRIDSALYPGMPVTSDYDSLIAKVIGWGEDRQTAIRRLRRALGEFQIGGVSTDIGFLIQIIDSDSFIQASANTTYLETFLPVFSENDEELERDMALTAAFLEDQAAYLPACQISTGCGRPMDDAGLARANAQLNAGAIMSIYYVTVGKKEYQIEINGKQYKIDGELVQAALVALKERGKYLLDGVARKTEIYIESRGKSQYTLNADRRHAIAKVERSNSRWGRKVKTASSGALTAPISGIVISVHVAPGDTVEIGQVLVVLESMKMQMEMRSACAGLVDTVNVQPKTQIAKGELLIKITPRKD